MPDCDDRPSDCEDVAAINTLDGFNVQPRLSIPFDGPIDVLLVTSDTVSLIKLPCAHEDESCDQGPTPEKVGINLIVWDTFANTLHVESDDLLDQHTRYALFVTRGVRPWRLQRGALLDAVHAARKAGVPEDRIAVASVFTTHPPPSLQRRSPFQLLEPVQYHDLRRGKAGLRRQGRIDDADESFIRQQVVTSWRTRSIDQESAR